MATPLQTYGVDVAQLRIWFPNVRIDTDAPVTPDVAEDMINESCAAVQVQIEAAGVDATAITEVNHPAAFLMIRRVIRLVIRPDLLGRAHHDTTQGADYDTWVAAADQVLLDFAKTPERYVGVLYRRHDTSTTNLNLATDEESRDRRREFDQVLYRKDGRRDSFNW